MKVTALNNQSLIDIAIAITGKADSFLQIAMANGLVPTAELEAGTELTIPEGLELDNDIVRYYQANGIQPATALTDAVMNEVTGCEGIGCWAIGVDFIVQ